MLDYTKSYVEKIHYIDAELAVAFLCLLCACLPNLTLWSELTNNTSRKQKWSTFLSPQI